MLCTCLEVTPILSYLDVNNTTLTILEGISLSYRCYVLFIVCCIMPNFCCLHVCGKDFISIGRHSWRCKKKLNIDKGYNGVDSSIQKQITPESMPVITNGDKDVKCTCGKQCKGLKGLKAHQRSCRVIQGLHENLIADFDQGSYRDEIDSTSGEFEESGCRLLSNIIHFDDENEGRKCGVQLPKCSHQWSVANHFFKAKFSNKPISSTGLNDTMGQCKTLS